MAASTQGGSSIARMKSLTGIAKTLPVLPQVAKPYLDPNYSVFNVTGQVAITGFDTNQTPILPGRTIILIGIDPNTTGPAITDTAIASTANGLISLSAALTLAAGSTVTFVQNNVGGWYEVARAANG